MPRSSGSPRRTFRSPTIRTSRKPSCRRLATCSKPFATSHDTDRQLLHAMRALPLAMLAVLALGASGAARLRPVETLAAVGGLPAHIAGQFSELSSCQQTAEG